MGDPQFLTSGLWPIHSATSTLHSDVGGPPARSQRSLSTGQIPKPHTGPVVLRCGRRTTGTHHLGTCEQCKLSPPQTYGVRNSRVGAAPVHCQALQRVSCAGKSEAASCSPPSRGCRAPPQTHPGPSLQSPSGSTSSFPGVGLFCHWSGWKVVWCATQHSWDSYFPT